MEKYIKEKLDTFKSLSPEEVYTLNEMYAVLESKGFSRKIIKDTINKVIKENIKQALEDL